VIFILEFFLESCIPEAAQLQMKDVFDVGYTQIKGKTRRKKIKKSSRIFKFLRIPVMKKS
jgi:CelD/BcsL family acetyltransferase involved in cellulose biosynthesis